MTGEQLLTLVDALDFRRLFIEELGWNNPDQPPAKIELGDHEYEFTQAASYKGLRVWHCATLPSRRVQRTLDELIGRTSHERLVIFSGEGRQEWRWPRRAQTSGANAKLLVHSHVDGTADPHLAEQLSTITLDLEEDVTLVALLERMRAAFDQEAEVASVQAARLMGSLYSALEVTGVEPVSATLLLARLLFLLFGDDGGMWRKDMFTQYLEGSTSAEMLHEDLAQLFDVLNTPEGSRPADVAPVLAEFRYVNGGLYRDELRLPPLGAAFRDALLEACAFDWAIISPAVFGSMFQTVKDREARRHGGEHYTTEKNILKTIGPLFLESLQARLVDDWNDKKRLIKLHQELGEMRFLDPACGCGNFLIVTYRELRALELELLKRLRDLDIEAGAVTAASRGQQSFDVTGEIKVTLDHFYGIEIEEWPARIAETAMLLVDHLANQRMEQDFGLAPDRLPITIAPTIVHGNALEVNWAEVVPSTQATVVLGNPPFIGISLRTAAQTTALKRVWGARYHGTLDYVTAWYKKAIDYVGDSGARFALVSTSSICQGEQVAPLWGAIFDDGFSIDFAHETFAWTTEAAGGAAVHVVIVGVSKRKPRTRQLFEYMTPHSEPVARNVENISPYLVEGPSIVVQPRTNPLAPDLPKLSYGNKPSDGGHLIVEPADVEEFRGDEIAAKFLRPYVGAREILHGDERWCLWLAAATPSDVAASALLAERVQRVQEFRESSDAASTREFGQPTLFRQISQPHSEYLGIAIHVSESRLYFPAGYFTPDIIASNANFITADPSGIALGIISSSMFLVWLKAVGGRLESRLRLSKTGVWNTFPMRALTHVERDAVATAGRAIVAERRNYPGKSLAELYDPQSMPLRLLEAHQHLDAVVDPLIDAGETDLNYAERLRLLFARYTDLNSANELHIPVSRQRRARR